MSPQRVMVVFGTRPEVIKMAPVIQALRRRPEAFETFVCSTGQHREMVDQALDTFRIGVDHSLHVMTPDQTLAGLTAALFTSLHETIAATRPDWVLTQGDTTTAFVAAMTAFYHRVRTGHVEAGLRTRDRANPFPEEINRRIVDLVSDLYFAPTERARRALIEGGAQEASVHVTGNTVVDAAMEIAARTYDWRAGPLREIAGEIENPSARFVLFTTHRRESFGPTLEGVCEAIRRLSETRWPAPTRFVVPVHLNPRVGSVVREKLGSAPNITLVEPLDYVTLIHLMKRCYLIITDSGGIQEEAPGLGVPTLVIRETTERPEGIEAGVARLVGTNPERITREAGELLRDPARRAAMTAAGNPYGDGRAGERIAELLAAQAHRGALAGGAARVDA